MENMFSPVINKNDQQIINHHKLSGLQTTEIYLSKFRGWEIQDPSLVFGRNPIPSSYTPIFLLSAQAEETRRPFGASFVRSLIPFLKAPPSRPNYFPKLPPPKSSHWGPSVCAVAQLCPALWDPYGLQPARLLCLWNFPSKNSGVGCHRAYVLAYI